MADTPIIRSRAAHMTLAMCCLFAATGILMPYLGRWLEVERGLSGAEIGLVLSLAQLTRIFTGPAVAFWADGVRDRRTPLRLLGAAAAISYAAFFLFAHDFASLLVLGFIAATALQCLAPAVEGAALRATMEGKLGYGLARGIGSLAFILANIGGGVLIARFGLGAVAVWAMSSLSFGALTSWLLLPRDPAPTTVHGRGLGARFADARDLLRGRRFVLLIISCGLIQSSHAFYYGFSTLVWRGQGIAPETVGWLWGVGVMVEVAFLWSLSIVERRARPEALILLGAGAGLLRWAVMGFGPTGLILWPLQALHGLSFAAAHVGAMRLLFRETPESSTALAQAVYAAFSGGILMGGATFLSGLMYQAGGAGGYWAMAGLSAAGALLATMLLTPAPRRRLNP